MLNVLVHEVNRSTAPSDNRAFRALLNAVSRGALTVSEFALADLLPRWRDTYLYFADERDDDGRCRSRVAVVVRVAERARVNIHVFCE